MATESIASKRHLREGHGSVLDQVQGGQEPKEQLKILEEHGLGHKKFFGGDEIGITDIAFGWMASSLDVIEEIVGVKLLEADSFPRLHAWVENFRDVPAIKENLPDRNQILAYYKLKRDMFFNSSTKP
ncbi:hypothetical protein F0562_002358 [Nyssa sinensis]|uniref:Glutathione S-transferase n=1 Tax=Nyssa sinensis TaxID=561372 RepID=A0A5J5C749_9ASTE|nr:hypothetical protein F0562_002358 [Nyssa sinensis]